MKNGFWSNEELGFHNWTWGNWYIQSWDCICSFFLRANTWEKKKNVLFNPPKLGLSTCNRPEKTADFSNTNGFVLSTCY
jgi:hypothetical protein